MHKAILYKKLGKNSVKCLACSHYCTILEDNLGICGVRENKKGVLYLLVYGKPAAAHVDPIEKKPLFHFLPGSDAFSIGTIGCNFGCDFCQNWDISQISKEIKLKFKDPKERDDKLNEVINSGLDLPPKKIVEYVLKNNIPSIAYTYNEPAIFFEYAYDTAKLAHKKGIKNVFVSNGYESKEALDKVKPYLDGINIDLKSFSDDFYRKICKARLQPVLENIKRTFEMGIWVEVTTLVIPGKNDSEKELTKIAKFIANISNSIPWHVSRFFPHYKMIDVEPTPEKTLLKAYEIGRKVGLKYVYVGNILDSNRESTYCPNCKKVVIGREGYTILEFNLENGKCKFCGEKIEGVWK